MKNQTSRGVSMSREDGSTRDEKNVVRQYELLDQICHGVSEENEYLAVLAFEERSKLGVVDTGMDEQIGQKYDLIQIKALMIQTLRRRGMLELFLDRVQSEYIRSIDGILCYEDYLNVGKEMIVRFCSMNRQKEVSAHPLLVQNVILEVDRDLAQNLTLQAFAARLNVNASYLSNLFRQETGETITDYVNGRRIQHAANLLESTQLPVKTVAKQSGIPDVHYFSRLFKKKLGLTPTQYRDAAPY